MVKNNLKFLEKLKSNNEKSEKDQQLKELEYLKKDIKYRVDVLIGDLLNLNHIKPNRLLNIYYKNRYDFVDKIYCNNDLYKNYDSETIRILINDILYNSIKEIEETEKKTKENYNEKVKNEMLKVLINKGKKISFQYPLRNCKLILSEFWNMDEINNLENGTNALNEYKKLFADEINKEIEEAEKEQMANRKSYGLGWFGYCVAFIVAMFDVFGNKKR